MQTRPSSVPLKHEVKKVFWQLVMPEVSKVTPAENVFLSKHSWTSFHPVTLNVLQHGPRYI